MQKKSKGERKRDFEKSIPKVNCPKCKTEMKHYAIIKHNYPHGINSRGIKRLVGFRYKCSECGLVLKKAL